MSTKKKYDSRLIYVLTLFVCFLTIIFLLVYIAPFKFFSSTQHEGISLVRDDQELRIYYNRISYYFYHDIPYKDNRIEYPPLAVAYLTIPAFFTQEFDLYKFAFIAQNIILTLLLVLVTYKLLVLFGRDEKWLWFFILPSIVYFLINRFDVLPAFLIQLSLFFLFKKQFTRSFIILSLAFLAKGYAIILFPIFFLYLLNHKDLPTVDLFKNRYLYILALPAIFITALIVILAGLENGLFPYIFQSTRNFAHGAVYLIYIKSLQPILPVWLWEGGVKVAAKVLTLLQVALPLIVYIGYTFFRKFIRTREDVINWSLLVILLYIQFSVYYSPQWFVWLLPLLILVIRRRREIWLIIFYDIMNYLHFPVVYNYAGPNSLLFDVVILIRTILLIIIILFIVQRIINRAKQVTRPAI